MSDREDPSIISAIANTEKNSITFILNKNCQLCIELDTEDVNTLTLTMTQSTAKEMLVVLGGIYGMEDWECCARFSKEQFIFLQKLAEQKQITMEDLLREMVQRKIDENK